MDFMMFWVVVAIVVETARRALVKCCRSKTLNPDVEKQDLKTPFLQPEDRCPFPCYSEIDFVSLNLEETKEVYANSGGRLFRTTSVGSPRTTSSKRGIGNQFFLKTLTSVAKGNVSVENGRKGKDSSGISSLRNTWKLGRLRKPISVGSQVQKREHPTRDVKADASRKGKGVMIMTDIEEETDIIRYLHPSSSSVGMPNHVLFRKPDNVVPHGLRKMGLAKIHPQTSSTPDEAGPSATMQSSSRDLVSKSKGGMAIGPGASSSNA